MVRFVHTADWQLGMRRHYLDADAQSRFSQARRDVIATILGVAEEHDAAFVVVAGDVFDDNQVDRTTVGRALDALRAGPDIPVLLLPGNHDPLDAGSVLRSAEFVRRCPSHVQVVADAAPIAVAAGVEVVGAPWRIKRPVDNPAVDVLAGLEPAGTTTRILLAHGGVDALVGDQAQVGLLRLATLEAAIAEQRVHFAALGDHHSARSVGETGRIWYAGAPEPTSYVEEHPGHALLVDVTPDDVAVEHRLVGRWTFRQRVFELTGDTDVEQVKRWLAEPEDTSRTIAKVALRGSLTLAERDVLDAALADAAETYAALEDWQRHAELVSVPDVDDLEALPSAGFVGATVEELRERVEDGATDAETASDALALLYRLVTRP